jgi:uncharacterized protein YlxP (DUF503 family)
MSGMVIGVCTVTLYLPGTGSLKEKRGQVKWLLTRLRREFNVTTAEVGLHDVWQSASIGVAAISTSAAYVQDLIDGLVEWIERNRPDLEVVDHAVEIISLSTHHGE